MPKIIDNPEARLLEEARKQIEQAGYGAMTIRSVAKACGIGVGTVYNYFSSKEELVATHLLEDWTRCVSAIQAVSRYCDSPRPLMLCIYDQLTSYANRHMAIFRDEAAAASFAGSFGKYHALLRGQLAEPLRKFCGSDFSADFLAESLLTWTMAGKSFDEIYGILEKLF